VFLIVGWGLPHQNILEYKQVFGGASPTLHHESLLVMDYQLCYKIIYLLNLNIILLKLLSVNSFPVRLLYPDSYEPSSRLCKTTGLSIEERIRLYHILFNLAANY